MKFTAADFVTRPGKRTCKYYLTCGSAENCKRCSGYIQAPQASDRPKVRGENIS